MLPVYKRIDTCAAEFASATPYMYSTYEGGYGAPVCEADPTERQKIIILGGGPNRIGQGIEFDYCCVHAAYALKEAGFETIMVNCNPETVSTDYDTSDRLYFEPLTAEDVIALVRREESRGTLLGCIVQYGGQTPLKLSQALAREKIPILGTSADAIDIAEDRERFQLLLQRLGLRQPENGIARSADEAEAIADRIGYPVVIRPSYVLGGRAMEIVYDRAGLHRYMREAVRVSGDNPVLIDRYLNDAIEVDVDCIADNETVYVAGVMEHIEEAGIHSGDSACSLPPYTLAPAMVTELKAETEAMAKALGVVGLMNVQYAIKDDVIYVLEVNPRASRTVPFVAKATGVAVAKIGARVMAGARLADFNLDDQGVAPHVAVKEAVFPFARFPNVDTILGPEMKSTGEVMGLDFKLRARLRQVAAWRGRDPARCRHGLPVDQGCRQTRPGGLGPPAHRDGLRHHGHPGHRRPHSRCRTACFNCQQGAGRAAALRGRHSFRRGAAGDQYRLHSAVHRGQFCHPPECPDPRHSALYDHGRRPGRGARHRRVEVGNA